MCFMFLYVFVKNVFARHTETQVDLRVKCGYCYPILTKAGAYRQSLFKLHNIKFHETLLSCSRVISCSQANKQYTTDGMISLSAQQGCERA
jgi:hypothetical protein